MVTSSDKHALQCMTQTHVVLANVSACYSVHKSMQEGYSVDVSHTPDLGLTGALHAQAEDDGEPFWAALASVLANTGRYYRQHLPAVQEALRAGMAPLEKQLEVLACF